jgi:serine phosphatase RsbU (regulator of sigma subunit)
VTAIGGLETMTLGTEPVAVLLVEDDEGDALLVRELLHGVDVRWVRSLADAASDARMVDCVLLDLALPDAERLEALDWVLASRPDAAVVVLTGDADERRSVDAVGAGAQDFLVKGQIDADVLSRSIRYAVARKRADLAARELYEAQARQSENLRFERGLVPRPLLGDVQLEWDSCYRVGGRRRVLGGDFYDVVQNGEGRVLALIGDVSGHGPDEAATGVALRIAARTLAVSGVGIGGVLPLLQRVLFAERQTPETFATVCVVQLTPGAATVAVALAGHPAPLIVDDGDVRTLGPVVPGPPIGVLEDVTWEPTTLEIPSAASLVLYTDGAIEGTAGAERLGTHGLMAIVRDEGVDTPGALDRIIEAAERRHGGPLTDDAALLVLRARRHAAG